MEMCKCLIFTFMAILAVKSYSQETTSTRLGINVHPIQSIKVNDLQQNVSLSLNTLSDYMDGKDNLQLDHVEVMSNVKYEVRVMAHDDLRNSTNHKIDVGLIEITPSFGNIGLQDQSHQFKSIALSQQENQLIVSQVGDIKRTFSMNYKLRSSEKWLNKPAGSYTAVITYTILSL